MALLYVLCSLRDELGISLRAVHVHHGLRGAEADRDAAWVQESCARLNVPCEVRYVDVREYVGRTGTSVEEGARILRYEALFAAARAWEEEKAANAFNGQDVSDKCPPSTGQSALNGTYDKSHVKIAVAHNLNDNAETILMQMARGSGLRGIGGIAAVNGRIIRPLLCVKRSEIEEYLTKTGISWVTDSTNLDDEYTRNRIRHRVLPELEAGVNSAAAEHIAAAGEMISQAYEYIRDNAQRLVREYAVCEEDLHKGASFGKDRQNEIGHAAEGRIVRDSDDAQSSDSMTCRFPVDVLRGQPQILRGTIVLMLIERICGTRKDISSVHVADIISLIDKETGKRIMLPYGLVARREYGFIYIERYQENTQLKPPRANKAHKADKSDKAYEENNAKELLGSSTSDEDTQKNTVKSDTSKVSADTEMNISGDITADVMCDGTDISTHFSTRILPYNGESVPVGEYTKWFDYDKISNSVAFRCRQPGDYIMLGGTGHKSVAAYMTDRKIPAARRDSIPMAADGSHIMWIVGYRISEAYKVTQTTKKVLEIRYIADEGETDG